MTCPQRGDVHGEEETVDSGIQVLGGRYGAYSFGEGARLCPAREGMCSVRGGQPIYSFLPLLVEHEAKIGNVYIYILYGSLT